MYEINNGERMTRHMRQIILDFYHYIDSADFDGLRQVMAEEAKVKLPNTRELFDSREAYIAFSKDYPGRWYANVERIVEAEHEVIAVAEITNHEISFYVTAFFVIQDGQIIEMTEYWGDNGEAPQWRRDKGYCTKY